METHRAEANGQQAGDLQNDPHSFEAISLVVPSPSNSSWDISGPELFSFLEPL